MSENTLERTPQQAKVQARIAWVRCELAAHDSNLALLQDVAEGRITLKGKGYTRGAENYRQTPADKARLPRTLANLQTQRERLLQELEILLEYGA
jgi:hypothetical protein